MEVILIILVILIASYFQGVTGFGQALIATPLALTLFNKSTALSISVMVGLMLNSYLARTVKGTLDRTLLMRLSGSALIGLPIGIWLAHVVSLRDLQVTVGLTVIISALLITYYRAVLASKSTYDVITGLISGIFAGGSTLSGPPVVLSLNAQRVPKGVMLKLLPTYFTVLSMGNFIGFGLTGLLDGKGLLIGIVSIPLIVAGGWLGSHVSHRLSQNIYRQITLTVVILSGMLAVYQGLIHRG